MAILLTQKGRRSIAFLIGKTKHVACFAVLCFPSKLLCSELQEDVLRGDVQKFDVLCSHWLSKSP